jgi:hemolysin III
VALWTQLSRWEKHGAVNASGTPAPGPSGHRLRLSGSDEAPRGRGLLHLAALVVALPAGAVLVWQHGMGGGVGLYALALVGLYAVSASYHLCSWSPPARRRMRLLDHEMIFVFIAACTTPYCLLAVPGGLSDVVLGLAWFGTAVAVLAIATRFEKSHRIASTAYIVLGWLAVVTLPEAVRHLGAEQLALLGSMALLYTAGAGVLAAKRPDPAPEVFGYHEVWHAMVVIASACGFVFVWSLGGPRH